VSDSPAIPAPIPVPIAAPILADLRRLAAGYTRPQAAGEGEDWLATGLARGQLHEVYAAAEEDAAAAAGFAAALALAAGTTPVVWLRPERQLGRLHATGLLELGLSPETLLLVVAADVPTLLRCAADIGRCAGVGMLVMESWGPMPALDLTATRRLVLAAEASGVTVVSLRCRAEPVASAAATRWRVAAGPSTALEANAPGAPAFEVECLRRRGGPSGTRRRVEWNRETRTFDPQDLVRSQQPGDAPPLAGTGLSLVAGGAAPRDPPASVRARR